MRNPSLVATLVNYIYWDSFIENMIYSPLCAHHYMFCSLLPFYMYCSNNRWSYKHTYPLSGSCSVHSLVEVCFIIVVLTFNLLSFCSYLLICLHSATHRSRRRDYTNVIVLQLTNQDAADSDMPVSVTSVSGKNQADSVQDSDSFHIWNTNSI